MMNQSLNSRLPGLMVASVPFAGWSLFNIGNTFSFTASYVVGILALIFNLARMMNIFASEGGRPVPAPYSRCTSHFAGYGGW